MKTLCYCIRCHSLKQGMRRFTNDEDKAIRACVKLNLLELEIKEIVCGDCRYYIGDEIANEMLKIFKR